MATSILTIGDRAEVVNELDLLALLFLLIDSATQARERYSTLMPFIERWEKNCVGYGPGTLDLQLEDIVDDQETESELALLLKDVEGKLSSYRETIPASLLSSCKAHGVTFKDYPISNVNSTIERIRTLIN